LPSDDATQVRFSAVRRVVLKAEMPELSVADISKVLGAEWSKLDQEAKAPYVAAAEAEKSSVLSAPKKPVIKLTSAGEFRLSASRERRVCSL